MNLKDYNKTWSSRPFPRNPCQGGSRSPLVTVQPTKHLMVDSILDYIYYPSFDKMLPVLVFLHRLI